MSIYNVYVDIPYNRHNIEIIVWKPCVILVLHACRILVCCSSASFRRHSKLLEHTMWFELRNQCSVPCNRKYKPFREQPRFLVSMIHPLTQHIRFVCCGNTMLCDPAHYDTDIYDVIAIDKGPYQTIRPGTIVTYGFITNISMRLRIQTFYCNIHVNF